MSLELIYTSAPRGLNAASSGFCTVAATGGISRQVRGKLESLSGYQFHFDLSDPQANLNPVNYAHTRVRIGADTLSVLSRIAFCGSDYSGRTNKIAHHVLLEHGEQMANGPAWMIMAMARRLFVVDWKGDPKHMPPRSVPSAVSPEPRSAEPATTWETMTGDAGWGGALAQAFRENPKVPAFVIFKPGQELLPLFEESLALLPPEERWQVGFATYYTALPAGCQYHWRGVLAGSPASREVARFPNATVIDLTAPLAPAGDSIFAEAARTGQTLAPVKAAARPKVRVVDRVREPVGTAAAAGSVARPAYAEEVPSRGPVDEIFAGTSPARDVSSRRRSRLVPALVAAVVLLAGSTVVLLFHGPVWPPPQAPSAAPAEPKAPGESTQRTGTGGQTAPKKDRRGPDRSDDTGQQEGPDANGEPPSQSVAIAEAKEKAEEARAATETHCNEAKEAADAAELAASRAAEALKTGKLDAAEQAAQEAGEQAAEAQSASESAAEQAELAKAQQDPVRRLRQELRGRLPSDSASVREAIESFRQVIETAKQANGLSQAARNYARQAKTSAERAQECLTAMPPKIATDLVLRNQVLGGRLEPVVKMKPDGHTGGNPYFRLGKGRRFSFLTPPEPVSSHLHGVQVRDGALHITATKGQGFNNLDLVKCYISNANTLVCDIADDDAFKQQYAPLLAWLTIEVREDGSGTVYQCVLGTAKGRAKARHYEFGYHSSGRAIDPRPVSFEYPWLKTLTVPDPRGRQEPLFQGDSLERKLPIGGEVPLPGSMKGEASSYKVDLSLAFTRTRRDGDAGTVGVTLEVPALENLKDKAAEKLGRVEVLGDRNISASETALRYEWCKWLEDERRKAEKQLKDNDDKNDQAAMKMKKAAAEMVERLELPVKVRMDAIARVVEAHSPIVVSDAWGLPVARIEFHFKKCAPGNLIKEVGEKKRKQGS